MKKCFIQYKPSLVINSIIFFTKYIVTIEKKKEKKMPCCNENKIQKKRKNQYNEQGVIDGYENMNTHDSTIEGLDNIGDSIKNAFEKPFNKMKDGINKFANDVKSAFERIPAEAQKLLKKDPLNGIVGKMIDFGDKIDKAFTEVPRRFNKFGKAFRDIFEGVGLEIKGVFDGLGDGFDDIGILLKYFGIFLQTYVECGVKYIRNFTSCVFYYIIDAILRMLYLPVSFSLWLLKSYANKDLYRTEALFWTYMWKLNDFIYSLAKFNILKWPKSVRDLCYNCDRLKVAALKREAEYVDYDFRHGIANKLQAGKDKINQAKDEFLQVFSP